MKTDTGRLWAITVKEVRQLVRDRLTFGMIVGIPLIQILLFGYAINFDVRELSTHVADQANTSLSRQLAAELEASQVLRITGRAANAEELVERLRRGEILTGLVIPYDLERRLQDGRPAAQLLVSGSDPTVVNVSANLRQFTFQPGAPAGLPAPRIETRVYYNPERRTEVQIVPALMGVLLNLTMVLFTAVAIVRERERGNMELLITTPTRTGELIVGKLLPYILIGLIQVTLILGVGSWLFDVPVRGGIVDLYVASLVFIAATLALGLLISTLAGTQFQAMQLTFFVFLPSILLSGFMFPFEGMPRAAQWVAEILPLTHFVRLVRGIVLRAAALGELWIDVAALVAFFVVVMTLTAMRFRKRLD
jgi:ABC-2 type transport system permease protein